MKLHVLPGGAYVDTFRETGIDGEVLVCRECLVEGDLRGKDLDEFFKSRAAFIEGAYHEGRATYLADVASQFRQLAQVAPDTEVHLWFEYELFCSVNLWFCLDLLAKTTTEVYRVAPVHLDEVHRWDGFGGAQAADLTRCFEARTKLTREDIQLGADLWRAFKTGDRDALHRLSGASSPAFPCLKEVCEAALEKDWKPAAIVADIQRAGLSSLREVFPEFRRRASVYGFGDATVQRLMDSVSPLRE